MRGTAARPAAEDVGPEFAGGEAAAVEWSGLGAGFRKDLALAEDEGESSGLLGE